MTGIYNGAAGLAELTELREKPAGTVRITTGDHQAEAILLPAISKLLPDYPDLHVEISVNTGFVDIVAERFDAGVRLRTPHDLAAHTYSESISSLSFSTTDE
jgi:DNA-binding transcriptional LysR family regulator